jgi:hypothetical protein
VTIRTNINLIYSNVPKLYYKVLKQDLNSFYLEKKEFIKEELNNNIKTNRSFSITLDAWTAINQDAFLGITM